METSFVLLHENKGVALAIEQMKQEKGISTSFFANPFGPMQRQEECRVLIDRIFDKLYEEKIPVGEVYTNLVLPDKEKSWH